LFDSVHQGEKAYTTVDELLRDLHEIRTELESRHDGLLVDLLEAFETKVQLFGFHFACLDIRQDSRKHEALMESILDRAGLLDTYSGRDEQGKIDLLYETNLNVTEAEMTDPLSHDIIGSINALKRIQEMYGAAACHRYIISNARGALDVVIVQTLIRWTSGETSHVDIVPLFESVDTLHSCGDVMNSLYQDTRYARHLASRKKHQTIMLGFSDGTKDGGYLQANWSIFKAKEALSEAARRNDVRVVFFDGRGGPPARGGGNTHKFYSSLGPTIDNHEVQITVQGQTISSHYGSVPGAVFNLEQLFTAGLEQSVLKKTRKFTPEQTALITRMAENGYKKYVDLKTRPDFLRYLEGVGTLQYYGETNIGSRPVKRGGKSELTLDSLRAIPFVSSWSQLKQNIPGYYGFGYALDQEAISDNVKEVQQLYQKSKFFQTLVGNSMQSLSKSFFPLTQYLNDDPEFGEIWSLLYEEYQLSLKKLLLISGQRELLDDSADIMNSIRMREMINLPVLTIQQAAIQRLRQGGVGEREAELYRKLILRTMYGIINAGRNSA
jgi:phosphoenolpyruvate carboxylase